MSRKLTTEEWVVRAKAKHGETFDYTETAYIDSHANLTVRCRRHGPFEQVPPVHLRSSTETACPECYKEWNGRRCASTVDEFVQKAEAIHGKLYDYSRVVYVNSQTKVELGCAVHGPFMVTPGNHLSRSSGCPKCAHKVTGDRCRMGLEDFLLKSREVHGDKYGYSGVEYKGNHVTVEIECSRHGAFWQQPSDHWNGHGCPKCGYENAPGSPKRSPDSVLRELLRVHGTRYTPLMHTYTAVRHFMAMKCHKHGDWKARAGNLLAGRGCPRCQTSKPQERVAELVDELTDGQCLHNTRKQIGGLELDVYVPSKKVAIEVNGIFWHSTASPRGTKDFEWAKSHQWEKLKACEREGIHLVHFYDDEVRRKWAAVNYHIRWALGRGIHVRGTTNIYRVMQKDAGPFHSIYGLGAKPKGITMGLYTEDDEPMLMVSAGLPENGISKISRITVKTYQQGGLREVLEALKQTLNCDSFEFLSEARLNYRDLYVEAGFEDQGTSDPSFFCQKGSRRIPVGMLSLKDFSANKKDNYDDSKTPLENWVDMGLSCVYDCGLTKWTLRL